MMGQAHVPATVAKDAYLAVSVLVWVRVSLTQSPGLLKYGTSSRPALGKAGIDLG